MHQRMEPVRDHLPPRPWRVAGLGRDFWYFCQHIQYRMPCLQFLPSTNVFYSQLFSVVKPSVTAKSYLCGF